MRFRLFHCLVYNVEATPVSVPVLFSRILLCVTTLLRMSSRHYTLKCVTDSGSSIHQLLTETCMYKKPFLCQFQPWQGS